jgi:hypothetical protein
MLKMDNIYKYGKNTEVTIKSGTLKEIINGG